MDDEPTESLKDLEVLIAELDSAMSCMFMMTFRGLSWCTIAFMTHFWRPIRDQSSFSTRERAYQSA